MKKIYLLAWVYTLLTGCQALPMVGAVLFEAGRVVYQRQEDKKQNERLDKIEKDVKVLKK